MLPRTFIRSVWLLNATPSAGAGAGSRSWATWSTASSIGRSLAESLYAKQRSRSKPSQPDSSRIAYAKSPLGGDSMVSQSYGLNV